MKCCEVDFGESLDVGGFAGTDSEEPRRVMTGKWKWSAGI